MPDNINPNFKHYIRIIGRGLKAGRSLTQQEAFEAMSLLLGKKITAEQRGAFLMLLRVREETAEELAGFTQACRLFSSLELGSLGVDLDMGCYAGKRRHLPWFILAVLALAQTGKRIFLHGTQEPDSQRLYLSEVLPQLGLPLATDAKQVKQQLERFGLAYMDLANFNPHLDRIIQLRSQFGLRSCANTLARMLNPTQAPFSLQGVFHRHVDEKHQQTALLLNQLDANQNNKTCDILCFRGEGGETEFNPEREVTLHLCRNTELQNIQVPIGLANWSMKDKQLDVRQLISFWQGLEDNTYAFHAITGTLALMYVLTEQLDWAGALNKAQHVWHHREKSWPLGIT